MRFKGMFKAASALLGGAVLAAVIAACGGGGGAAGSPASANTSAVSSGAITAFGSVYVNGRRYGTSNAKVIDDDSGAVTNAGSALEVGMVVDVKPAAASMGDGGSEAAELHLHPLVRGVVDASDGPNGTLTVMGQAVQVTSATLFSDRRACASATVAACTAVSSQGGLVATTGQGASATPGSFVVVHGYLYGSADGAAQVVATLVSVLDAPASGSFGYKVEGLVTAASGTSLTIGGLTVDLASATCTSGGAAVNCSGAYAVGQVVSAGSATAPELPATAFSATRARLAGKIAVETDGAAVEFEGSVSSVTGTAFVVRGVTVDGSALTALPAVGDIVRVVGTVSAGGQGVTASSLSVLRAASSRAYGLEGDVTAVAAGTDGASFTVTVLGQAITVNTTTRLADRQLKDWSHHDPANSPFNIGTFQAYLAASASQHVLVKARTDAGGALVAQSLTLEPMSARAALTGPVDATPAPFNSAASGTPSTFSVHGVAVSADPAAIFSHAYGHGALSSSIAVGDTVTVYGSFNGGTLAVGAIPSRNNAVIDLGLLSRGDHCEF